jgi:hypothetical protein
VETERSDVLDVPLAVLLFLFLLCSCRQDTHCPAVVSVCLQVITSGALIMELAAVFVLGATIITYDYFSSRDSMSSIGYF